MAKKLKGLIAIVSVGMLIYLVSSANTSVAEDVEIDAQERFAGATISVEASVVIVELEALEEITGELDTQALNSIPLDKIMQCIREDEGGEMVSAVKLTVGNKSVAEMNTEENEEEKRKHSEEETGERENRETYVSFRVTPEIIDVDKIAVSFDFKQFVSKSTLFSESNAEEQHDIVTKFEVSSKLVLRPGQPRIVGATKKDEATFLILGVDI